MPASTTLEFKMSEVPQFERLVQFLEEAIALAKERDDGWFEPLAQRAVDDLAAMSDA